MNDSALIQKYVDALAASADPQFDAYQSLRDCGVSPDDAALVHLLTPMAFAYERLSALGVDLPLTFSVESSTGERQRARLFDQPLFLAARKLAMRMADGDAEQQRRLQRVVLASAEWNAAQQLAGPQSRYDQIRLTEALLVGFPLQRLQRPAASTAMPEPAAEPASSADVPWQRSMHWVVVLMLLLSFMAMPLASRPEGRIAIALLQAIGIVLVAVMGAMQMWSALDAARSRWARAWIYLWLAAGTAAGIWLVLRASMDPEAPPVKVRIKMTSGIYER